MDAIYPILNHARSVDAARLSPELIAVTRRFILDTLAVMMAGRRATGCAEVARYVTAWQGQPDAMLATGQRAPAPYAAMANAMMAHAVEFDDTYEPADVHAYAVVLPAVLAAAELDGARTPTGKDLIAAVAVGIDIAYRMGSAIRNYRGWHPTATCGIFGATLAATRIANGTEAQFHNAMGLAYSLAAGNFQAVIDGSLSKRMQPGFAARGAVEAVLLARAGLTGAKDIFEGVFGFYRLYEAGEYDRAALLDSLGTDFLGLRASMKPYPCCRFCHAAIDAALAIAAARQTRDAITDVTVEIPPETYDYVGNPFVESDNPVVSAQFSVAYTVASALLRGKVGLAEFTLDAVRDPSVRDLAQRVKAVAIESGGRYGAVTVRVKSESGRTLERRVSVMKGESTNPLSDAELREKVSACLRYGGANARTADALYAWAERLDQNDAPLPALHAIFREETVQ